MRGRGTGWAAGGASGDRWAACREGAELSAVAGPRTSLATH